MNECLEGWLMEQPFLDVMFISTFIWKSSRITNAERFENWIPVWFGVSLHVKVVKSINVKFWIVN